MTKFHRIIIKHTYGKRSTPNECEQSRQRNDALLLCLGVCVSPIHSRSLLFLLLTLRGKMANAPRLARVLPGSLAALCKRSNLVEPLIHLAEVYASNRLVAIEQFLLLNGSL